MTLAMPVLERELSVTVEIQEETPVPCEITPEWRRLWCKTPDSHKADVQVLYSCGCVTACCKTSYERFFGNSKVISFVCSAHGPQDVPCELVATEWLK